MTRPQIIRADTIDLQDKTSPTAQDHSAQPHHPAPYGIGPAAPHQQAAIRHAEEDRQAEDVRLQKAWSISGSTLRDDPGSDDEVTMVNSNSSHRGLQQDEQAVRLNGSMSMEGDDADLHDADMEDDLDDDLMDKISSSPSIDDGGYPLPSQPPVWPARRESLTPLSSPIQPSSASSSPFTNTPPHFPLSAANARRPLRVPARDNSPWFPISFPSSLHLSAQSMEHHQREYASTRTTGPGHDTEAETQVSMNTRSTQTSNIESELQPVRDNFLVSCDSNLDKQPAKTPPQKSHSLTNSMDDPFMEITASPPRTTNGTPPPTDQHHDGDGDSWTTDSDADSWAEDMDQDEDDASHDVSFSDDPRFIDSGWGGECLRETEDIDFEFVYALHTFVATVEGQANATKGDTMVLLDDSNSYWWLVRIVKDNSIGYLPAEHIETPTERLARLNKHRNIDLSATMLGDTAEKSKNPLKKAMRRRNAKTVQFGMPTYVEASDYDYSSDEGEGELFGGPEPKQMQQQQQEEEEEEDEEQQQQQAAAKAESENEDGTKVQPLQVNGTGSKGQIEGDVRRSNEDTRREEEKQRASEEALDRPMDPKVTRNGTLRNTDSFFKDENTETRKITLTPNLLRDDSSPSTTVSRERGPSLESLEKNGFADKVKDKKDKKEKKGMLSGLFKRKDKKGKGIDAQDSDMERSEELDRPQGQSKPSDESIERPSIEQVAVAPAPAPAPAPVRNPSKGKLQKVQRSRDDSPQKTKGILKNDSPIEPIMQSQSVSDAQNGKPTGPQAATMRAVSPEQEETRRQPIDEPRPLPNGLGSNNPFNKMVNAQQKSPNPETVKAPKQRMQLDDFDSDESSDPFADPDAQKKIVEPVVAESTGRLSESPVHVSVADAQPAGKSEVQERDREPDPRQPPGLTTDNSSQETTSPISTPTPDDSPQKHVPEHVNGSAYRNVSTPSPTNQASGSKGIPAPTRPAPVPTKNEAERGMSPPISSDSAILPAWSDASLRAYLDDGSDIRDMLLVVNDTTGVLPVGKDHPFMRNLFVEESRTVQGMSGELDRLLNGLLNKRVNRSGSNASSKISSSGSARSTSGSRLPVR